MWQTLREISGTSGTSTPRVRIYFVARVASLAQRSWKWGIRCEPRLQVQAGTATPLHGGSRAMIAYQSYGEQDGRNSGPRSGYGIAMAQLRRAVAGYRTISAPASAIPRHEHPGSLSGDLYLTRQPGGYYRRIGWDGKMRGIAMRRTVETVLRATWPVETDADGRYWEHGASVADIDREENAKRAVALAKRDDAKTERRVRLLARISERVQVFRADARAAGACDAGIEAFCIAHDLARHESVSARDLAQLAITARQPLALRAAMVAARRAII